MNENDCINKADFLEAYDKAMDKLTTGLIKSGASLSQVKVAATYVSVIIAVMEIELFGAGDEYGN